MANIKSFPNNQDEYIGAEDVMKWLHGRTTGVFAAENNAAVSAVLNEMAVTVSDGVGWIADAKGDGVVWWNDHEALNDTNLKLAIDTADGALDRIDRIIVEWKTTNYVDLPEIKVLKGGKASNPTAPSLTNNSTVRQLSLARVYVAAGTTAITSAMITDERLDPSVCGLVSGGVSIDTSMMDSQFNALLESIKMELSNLEAGTGVELKKLQYNNVGVDAINFIADPTYEAQGYGYRAAVDLVGVIGSMIPEVVFELKETVSGIFAPVAETYDGGIYLYASSVPEDDINIPTIICWKGAM